MNIPPPNTHPQFSYLFRRRIRVRVINLACQHVIGGGRRLLSRHQSGGNFACQTTLVIGHFNTVDGLTGCSGRRVIQSCRYSINWARSTYKQMMKMMMVDDKDTSHTHTYDDAQTKNKKREGKTNQFLTGSNITSIWTRFEKKRTRAGRI